MSRWADTSEWEGILGQSYSAMVWCWKWDQALLDLRLAIHPGVPSRSTTFAWGSRTREHMPIEIITSRQR